VLKKKTSARRAKFSRSSGGRKDRSGNGLTAKDFDFSKLTKHDHTKGLEDPKLVSSALIDCLKEGDTESFREILVAHLRVAKKSKLAKEAKLGRQTFYDWIEREDRCNPTLETIGSIFKALNKAA
jgi:DNA-binding phage protein